MGDPLLLIVLAATQFMVHALGWAMAAGLTRRWRDTEGHFAALWLMLATALLLLVSAWPLGHPMRLLARLLIVAAFVVQHRGMALYWGIKPNDRAYLALLVAFVSILVLSLGWTHGHGMRVAAMCASSSMLLLATMRLIWQRARDETPVFAVSSIAGYSLITLALLARVLQALSADATTKISIETPGHQNVPLTIIVLFVGGLINLAHIRLVLGRVLRHLTQQALTDALTGAANRRGLMQQAAGIHSRAQQGGRAYVVLMVDIDNFKTINDRYGHAEGDKVLKRVAQNLRDGLRVGDVVSRWGGEEFCVLLPSIALAEAHALAERLIEQIAATGDPRVTVSIGVAEVHAVSEEPDGAIRRADAALYQAKKAGRNRAVSAANIVLA